MARLDAGVDDVRGVGDLLVGLQLRDLVVAQLGGEAVDGFAVDVLGVRTAFARDRLRVVARLDGDDVIRRKFPSPVWRFPRVAGLPTGEGGNLVLVSTDATPRGPSADGWVRRTT
jgi:hypothetical protein